VTHVLPWGAPLTYADLQAMPDDGHRYELIDGVLIVNPSPRRVHQRAVSRLLVLLHGAATPEIEVLSPSTRRFDLGTKRLAFEGAGVPSYWLVDPDEPSLTVLELERDTYREIAQVTGAQAYKTARPFDVTVVPADLVR